MSLDGKKNYRQSGKKNDGQSMFYVRNVLSYSNCYANACIIRYTNRKNHEWKKVLILHITRVLNKFSSNRKSKTVINIAIFSKTNDETNWYFGF